MGKRVKYWVALVLLPLQASWAAPCQPECRSGFMCLQGRCVSRCNPPCPAGEVCTDQAECVSKNADLPPPPPPPQVGGGPTGSELPPPPPPPGLDGSPPPPVPGPGYAPLYPQEPQNPRLLQLKSELHEAREAPSLASGITMLAIGTSLLIASFIFWGVGLNWFGTFSRFGYESCGTRYGAIYYCIAGFPTGVTGLVFTPIGLVRFIRALVIRPKIPGIEEEIRSLGGIVPPER